MTQAQFRQWLAVTDLAAPGQRFADRIPGDPANAINIGWHGPFVMLGDALSNSAKTYFGYTVAQMQSQFLVMASYPITPL